VVLRYNVCGVSVQWVWCVGTMGVVLRYNNTAEMNRLVLYCECDVKHMKAMSGQTAGPLTVTVGGKYIYRWAVTA
jgi:hypothetical protein